MRNLSPLEARVLGVLVEKQHTVPDTYPLSVNALTAGCNQKTARFPVIEATEAEVMTAVDALKGLSLVFEGSGSRVVRFEHNMARVFSLPAASVALLTMLMLRGAQTSAELRLHCERLHRFADISSVEGFLEEMAGKEPARVVKLPRAPGARGSFTTRGGSLAASSSKKPSTDEMSAKRCSRSQFSRNSAAVCGPRSISTANSATADSGTPWTRPRLCSNLITRLLLPSNTRLRPFRPSRAVSTSASVASITGARAVFWLQPATSVLSDSG